MPDLQASDCLAVRLAFSRQRVEGSAHEITRRVRRALEHLPSDAPLDRAVEANVRFALMELRERSRALREREAAGGVEIAGAVYDLDSGRIHRL